MRDDTLTREQRAIVDAPLAGPSIVNAGAGTGKTYTLVRRAVRLVESKVLTPRELLVVTFTNKAANEIAERLAIAFEGIGVFELPTCGTFHAIAASLLREFAYETGDSPDLRAIDDARARGVFRGAYEELLAGKLGVGVSALPVLDREDVLIRDLASLAFVLKNEGTTIDQFEREALAAVPELRSLPFGQLYTLGKKPAGARLQPAPDPGRTAADLSAEADREERNVWAVGALLRRFDELLAEGGVLTYGDLLGRAIAMLKRNPAIAERVRRRWRHALVDEFQDTNPQQLAFVRAIFGNELIPVMAVGDARQAIYEWNGADPLGILRLAEASGTKTFSLTRNRRSFQEILNAAHDVLPAAGPGAAEAALVAEKGRSEHIAIRHATFAVGANVAECRETESRAIAAEIAGLVAAGEKPSDIAILLRSRPAARVYALALRDRGIASRTHGGVGFFDAPEIVDAIAWFRLALDPANRHALTRVLESPVVGLSDGSIAELYASTPPPASILAAATPASLATEEAGRIERVRSILAMLGPALGLPLPEAVRTILRETAADAAQVAAHPNAAAQIRANVAKLISLAEGLAHDLPLARLSELVAEIDERALLEDDEPEAELGGDEVAIMTIHAAKGLEWNHVFVANVSPSTFPNNRGARESVVMRDPTTKALAFSYGVDGKKPFRWHLRESHDARTGQRIKVEPDISEERRLFYVALTRAKSCVWISGVARTSTSKFLDDVHDHVGRFGTGAPFPHPDAASAGDRTLVDRCSMTATASRAIDMLQARLLRQPSLFEPWRGTLSYTAIAQHEMCPRLARYRYALHVPDFRESPDIELPDADDTDGASRKIDAATYGNIVHRVLEMIASETIAKRPYDRSELVDAALREFESEGDVPLRARIVTATERAIEALAGYEPVAAEEAFDATIAGASVGGFIDLIARDATGTVWIVDYKTGRLPDSAYALQLALYRMALRTRYPGARLAILRIADDAVRFVEPEAPTESEVERVVVDAASMDRDEPRTGPQCRDCAYAGPLCAEGAAYNASATSSA